MYKAILAVVTVLSFSQAAFATERSEIWNCLDSDSLTVKEDCMVSTIEKHTDSDKFFDQLANKSFEPKRDVLATITYFPAQNLIQIQAMHTDVPVAKETEKSSLLAAKR